MFVLSNFGTLFVHVHIANKREVLTYGHYEGKNRRNNNHVIDLFFRKKYVSSFSSLSLGFIAIFNRISSILGWEFV